MSCQFPSTGDLPDPGIEPESPPLQADSLPPSYQESLRHRSRYIYRVQQDQEGCFSYFTLYMFLMFGFLQTDYAVCVM